MRLFLHGRSTKQMLSKQLKHTRSEKVTSLILSKWDARSLELMEDNLVEFLSKQTFFLEEITLQNCAGDLQRITASILKASPKSFTIRYDQQQSRLNASIARGLLEGSPNSKVSHFELRGVTITPDAIDGLIHALPQIAKLESISFKSQFTLEDLDRKKLTILGNNDEQIEYVREGFAELLNQLNTLASLNLDNCHIQDHDLAAILLAAQTSCPRLISLGLKGNLSEQCTSKRLKTWLQARDCSIERLDLSWQRISRNRKQSGDLLGILEITEGLRWNKSLRTLLLSDNTLRRSDLSMLVSTLEMNTSLRRLELRNCFITSEGFAILAKSLPYFHLTHLDLGGQQRVPGQKLKSMFCSALRQNVFLFHLTLPDIESRSIAWLLEWNRAGRQVLVQEELLPELWPQLLERANRVCRQLPTEQQERHSASAIFYLLREKGLHAISCNRSIEASDRQSTPTEACSTGAARTNCHTSPSCTRTEVDQENKAQRTYCHFNRIHPTAKLSGEVELEMEGTFNDSSRKPFNAVNRSNW